MPNDLLSPVLRGEVLAIRADTWNRVLDSARDFRQPRRPDRPVPPRQIYGVVEALALNSTGADLREFQPAAVTAAGGYDLADDSARADWQRKPLLTIGVPAAVTDFVAVTLEAIPDGAIGRVAVAGTVVCDVNLGSADAAAFARPTVGTTDHLTGTRCGPIRVLHVPDDDASTRPCVVALGDQTAGGCDPYPLTPLPCLVRDGYGDITGLAQIWYDPADGTAECRTSGSCACPPSDPPSAETSCCSLWYCTADGPVEVSADGDGVYTPPVGWDGTEPHLTEAAALAACPVPVPALVCPDDCGYDLWNDLFLNFTDATGTAVGFFPPDVPMALLSNTGTVATFQGSFADGVFNDIVFTLTVECSGTSWYAYLYISCDPGPTTSELSILSFSSPSGWSGPLTSGPVSNPGVHRLDNAGGSACAALFTLPLEIGTLGASHSGPGSIKLVLSL